MPKDIKTRFTIEGEQQYRQSMRDAANAVKVLNSEQKLAAAQFKNTGNAEKYAADQARILQEKIKQQEQAVRAAEKALKELAEDGVNKNSKRWQEWQTRLNNAQTTLVNMQTEMNSLGGTMDTTSTKADGLTDSLSGISKKISLQNITSGLKSIDSLLTSAAKSALEIGKNLVSSVTEGASWADDLLTNSLIYGIDQDTLQKWSRAATHFDTSVEAMVKSRQKLAQNMKYGSDEVMSGFAELGVNIYDTVLAGGKSDTVQRTLRKTEDILWEVGEALVKLDRDDPNTEGLAMKLLGRNWSELLPLFTAGRKAYDEFMAEQSTVGSETVQNMADANDALDALRYEWSVTLHQLEGSMAPALESVSNILQGVLKEFNDYLSTEEGQQKMQELADAVTSLFEGLKDIKPGDVIDTAKDILTGIVDALKWINNNWTTVETGIKAIVSAWLGLKALEGVTTVLKLASGMNGLNGGSGSGTGTGTNTNTVPVIPPTNQTPTTTQTNPIPATTDKLTLLEYIPLIGTASHVSNVLYGDLDKAVEQTKNDAEFQKRANEVAEFVKKYKEEVGRGLSADQYGKLFEYQAGKTDEIGIDIEAELKINEEQTEKNIKLCREALGIVEIPAKLVFVGNYWAGRRPVGGGGGAYYVEDVEQLESHANGLPFVPYDGYHAILHKGERVLTAGANRNYTYNSNTYFGSVNLNNGLEIDALSESIARQNRRHNAGYGT